MNSIASHFLLINSYAQTGSIRYYHHSFLQFQWGIYDVINVTPRPLLIIDNLTHYFGARLSDEAAAVGSSAFLN
jgi:hypothetical protein